MTCSILLAACSPKTLGEIQFDDTPLFTKKADTYEGFMGTKYVYCLWGKYRGVAAGTCINMKGGKFTFSIAEVISQNPSLDDANTEQAAGEQQVKFKRSHSQLYNEAFQSRYYHQGIQ